MQIFVKTSKGETIILPAAMSETIGEMKAKIKDATGIPPDRQCLMFAETRMKDDHRLTDYGVRTGSTLHLSLLFIIHVKTVTGEKITLPIFPATIGELKAKIQDEMCIPKDQQCLTFAATFQKSVGVSRLEIRDGIQRGSIKQFRQDGRALLGWVG